MNKIITILSLIFLFNACYDNGPLPILGEMTEKDGEEVPHYIPDFNFINQDGEEFTQDDLDQKIYVADFFFTHCPSICPTVTKAMLRIKEKFEEEDITLVSFTMDPVRDTPERLKKYATDIEVSAPKWVFLTGEKKALHDISTDFFSVVIEDDEAPGGFNHTGNLLLVDKNKHIRAFCEGTDEEDVDEFMKDIKKLLLENEK